MTPEYTAEQFRAKIESALEPAGIAVRIEVRETEPIGLMINARRPDAGDEQDVFAAGPISLSLGEVESLVERIRAHFTPSAE